ncbi:MAG TPA: hypothetical protein DCX52_14095 [Massilia sp.]|nr:hypothetical protein [Massilia sp.]
MALQQHLAVLGRTLLAPKSDTTAPAPLPSIDKRANKLLSFDESGNPIAVAATAQSATAVQLELASSGGSWLVGCIQAGAGAVKRLLQNKQRDRVSVRDFTGDGVDGVQSNQVGIVAAVAYAYANDLELEWPAGTYVSTASIPNFHEVVHLGRGVIKRGATTYFITPRRDSHTNIIEVAPTGDDANDGITADLPVKTAQRAFDILQGANALPKLRQGTWRCHLSAGIYIEGASWNKGAQSANYVEFYGDVDGANKPTTVFDGSASAKTAGLYFDGGPAMLRVKNILSKNFRTNSIASGFVFANKGINKLFTDNLWSSNNLWTGINADSIGQWNAQAGTHDGNTNYNLRARGGVAISIGRPGAGNRITLKNNVTAVQIRDCCSGHFDYVDIINHATTPTGTGLWVTNDSRVVLNSCTLTNCNLGILAENGATFGAVGTTYTNVPTEYRTSENATRDQDDGYLGGEGLAYDSFFKRYSVGLRAWGGNPFSATAFAWATTKTGTADFAFLVPDATLHRFMFGRTSNTTHMRMEIDCATDRWSLISNNVAVLRATPTELNSGRDNAASLGSGGARYTQLYAATGSINTSDEREKQQVSGIDAAVLRAWAKVNFCQFKFNDAVQEKCDGARWHFGVLAQRVKDAFESEGLDPFAYGVLCFDSWPEQPEILDDQGGVTQAYHAAGERYGIRYEEAFALECAYLRSLLGKG